MGRIIQSSAVGEFPPMVGLRTPGNYVKGKVTAIGTTTNGNPVVTLSLIDLEGSTSKSTSKGVYEEVEVNAGDSVQLVGSVKQLREAIPQLVVGDVVHVKFIEKIKIPGGKTKNKFFIEVE